MTVRFRVAPLLGVFLAGTALAQTPPEGSLKAKPTDAPPAEKGSQPGEMDPDGNYTIKRGDTLWDLSQQFLNNPWYWPKIWADNPSVENPHWIYPGNRLKISRKGEGLPGELSTLQSDDEPSTGFGEGEEIRNKELEDFSAGSVKGAGAGAKGDDGVSMGGSVNSDRLTRLMPHVRLSNIVTEGELEAAGTISHSAELKTMLSMYDKVYLDMAKLSDVKIGARYTVFRPGEKVEHPQTGETFGYRTYLLGEIEIIGKTQTEAIGLVGRISDGVQRGDRLALIGDLDKLVRETPNEAEVVGTVVTAEVPGTTLAGHNHVVFLDRGSKDRVKIGNTFQVVQSTDGLERIRLPNEKVIQPSDSTNVVATLVVVSMTDHSSAAMVVKALHEVSVGDRVEMHRAGTVAGAGGDVR